MIGPISITVVIHRDYYSHYKCVKYYTKIGMILQHYDTRYLCFWYNQSQMILSRKCRLVLSLRGFSANDLKWDEDEGLDDWPEDMLSTPSSFQCCLSQDSITCTCLSPLLLSVLLELCSSGLPPNLVKGELASTPTLSLDFLIKGLRCRVACHRGLGLVLCEFGVGVDFGLG